MSDTNPAALTPDRKQEIRERLNSTLAVRKSDAEALLAEADRLRAESDQLYSDLTGAYLDRWEESQDNIRLRVALASAHRGRRELRARVAELEGAASCSSEITTSLGTSECALPVRHQGDHRNAEKNHHWSDEFATRRTEAGTPTP
ncbi:hypothetical protein [Streptomyces sp. NBC_00842]|uniref:hypothetical protein n=1 Tax=Streptomyces sp. NBC_00842 TaxID=2975848 RepID=UPI002F911523|nr:hypothetical protein OH821_45360 [Streptomyces sp. NBC_00842]